MLTIAAWDFIEKEKPNFDLVTLAPPMVYGPLRHSVKSVKELNQSNSRIYDLFVNSKNDADEPPNGLHTYVDVRVSNFHQKIYHKTDKSFRISQQHILKPQLCPRHRANDLSSVLDKFHLSKYLIS